MECYRIDMIADYLLVFYQNPAAVPRITSCASQRPDQVERLAMREAGWR